MRKIRSGYAGFDVFVLADEKTISVYFDDKKIGGGRLSDKTSVLENLARKTKPKKYYFRDGKPSNSRYFDEGFELSPFGTFSIKKPQINQDFEASRGSVSQPTATPISIPQPKEKVKKKVSPPKAPPPQEALSDITADILNLPNTDFRQLYEEIADLEEKILNKELTLTKAEYKEFNLMRSVVGERDQNGEFELFVDSLAPRTHFIMRGPYIRDEYEVEQYSFTSPNGNDIILTDENNEKFSDEMYKTILQILREKADLRGIIGFNFAINTDSENPEKDSLKWFSSTRYRLTSRTIHANLADMIAQDLTRKLISYITKKSNKPMAFSVEYYDDTSRYAQGRNL